ncbi:MAG: hypothetical protein Q8P45_02910 [Candidatus Harrisonbacteria bacterium]|nr:hypothetical protein [Candidatus Harrisonbacteria bacterium]
MKRNRSPSDAERFAARQDQLLAEFARKRSSKLTSQLVNFNDGELSQRQQETLAILLAEYIENLRQEFYFLKLAKPQWAHPDVDLLQTALSDLEYEIAGLLVIQELGLSMDGWAA